ncbi:cobalamin biosynthesis protein [Paracoccus sp. Z118]|uniref:cobalamin biosynthesis protein n=1 Tax=Paracoccus sp. Z118 TaxID=2851017 RepID=UPI001C2C7694|nr:cobalamin biosynthesis protein [Paracoccus sp. Z118]MBV0892716.1 cobalamin biosynthesis protein [Paracoccus sp. Z118]
MRVVGLGFRARASLGSIEELFRRLQVIPALTLALPEFREEHPVVHELQALGFRVTLVPEAALNGLSTFTRSPRILARYGTGSLAEACALVAAGPAARLVLPRVMSADRCATAALAQSVERPDP